MGDEDDRREFITANATALSTSTIIGTELVLRLFEKGLINQDEKYHLNNQMTSEIARAMTLYTTTANKWSQSQFEEFKAALKDTGNLLALQIFTKGGADVFLTNDQVQLLREQAHKSESVGCYEGLFQDDEVKANRLVQIAKGGELFGEDLKFKGSAGLDRKEIVPLVTHFGDCLKRRVIWWNPRKSPLPRDYVVRSVAPTNQMNCDGTFPSNVATTTLVDLINYGSIDNDGATPFSSYSSSPSSNESSEDVRMLLLVDPPGMGKSSEMSYLEYKMRIKVSSNRIILRVNLNETQAVLKTLSSCESASCVLLKLAPFLPENILNIPTVRVFLLLDGLDEVCPKHKDTMVKLLRKFTSGNEQPMCSLRLFVSTRPHYRQAVEDEFKREPWSLLPLSKSQQNVYIGAVCNVTSEQIRVIRGKMNSSVEDLLGNPLMLSMFVDVIKSGGNLSEEANDLNIFDLYMGYMNSKHKLHLVEKGGMREEDNFTQTQLELLLERNLPHYYRVAMRELIDEEHFTCIIKLCEGCAVVSKNEPAGVTRDELLSVGLLVEINWENPLVFKHRSFAEFFYARLLTQEKYLPQGATDALFRCIYDAYLLENVEAFVVGTATSSSKTFREDPCGASPTHSPPALLFKLSPQWIINSGEFKYRCMILCQFVQSFHLFPLLAREALLSFVNGDPTEVWEAQDILLHEYSSEAFKTLFDWMNSNREWTRGTLLKIHQDTTTTTPQESYPPGVARLMARIAVKNESQLVLTEDEIVSVAINSVDRLVLSVESKRSEARITRTNVDGFVSGRGSHLGNLFMQIDSEELSLIIQHAKSTCKLVLLLSHEEILSLTSINETRISDVVGERPQEFIVALGDEFISPKQLANFRAKFGKKKQGKTVFEMSENGCDFAVEYLWDDLVREMRRGDASGPVTTALRETFGRMRPSDSWKFLKKLEQKVNLESKKGQESNEHDVGRVMDWVTKGLHLGQTFTLDSLTCTLDSLDGLPFLLRYYKTLWPTSINNFPWIRHRLDTSELFSVLRSLIIASSLLRIDSNDERGFSSYLADFLQDNRHLLLPYLQDLVELFLRATGDQILNATVTSPHLVSDVSVGGVALNLIAQQQHPAAPNKKTWEVIAYDVIRFTPCCDLNVVLQQLRWQLNKRKNSEMLKKEVLTNEYVLFGWRKRFSSEFRRDGIDVDLMCGVSNILSFYFSVFGHNLNWMKMRDGNEMDSCAKWTLVGNLPVEISMALLENPQWAHLIHPFHNMLAEYLQKENGISVRGVSHSFSYKSHADWETFFLVNGETLLPLISEETLNPLINEETIHPLFAGEILHNLTGETLQPFVDEEILLATMPVNRKRYISVVAPLLRTLIKMYGVKWTNSRIGAEFWKEIPCSAKTTSFDVWKGDSVCSLCSLLHSAIQLGQLEEVQKRAYPGLLTWRNGEGQTAPQLAREIYDELNPIRIHIEQLNLRKWTT